MSRLTSTASSPCRFPHLASRATPSTSRRPVTSVRIPFTRTASLLPLLSPSGAPSSLLLTSWALLLRCYTGQDTVTFGIEGQKSSVVSFNLFDTATVSQTVGSEHFISKAESAEFDTDVSLWDFGTTANAPQNCRSIRLLAKYDATSLVLFLEWNSSVLRMTSSQGGLVASTLSKILEGLHSATPTTTLGDISSLSGKNLAQICEWNRKIGIDPVDMCVHDTIAERVIELPDKEAICAWDGSLTYKELDIAASQLANSLISTGLLRENNLVPLCFDKSKWTIVAMLAVSKAGGAFVPLDPAHPAERLKSLYDSIEASSILCSRNHVEMLSSIFANVIAVDEAAMAESAVAESVKLPVVSSADVVYVIFTSGSTGKPKGTIISHSAFCSSARAHAPALLIDSGCRVLQFAAHTFDASLVEILTPLMVGGTVCIPSEHERLNGVAGFINRVNVNHAVLTPSFVGFLDPAAVPSLRRLVLAGEAMGQSHVATWSHIGLVNGYGPAESSVAAVVNPHVGPDTAPNDIGMPCGVRVWLVDPADHNRLVPVGCVGEMLLEGPTLAKGYLGDPIKTQESFIAAPIWAEQMAGQQHQRHFYKTGDLARYISDGSLSYLGRKDTQVKLHGQRIELGEIEHHLSTDDSVQHAMVLLPKAGPLATRLITVLSLAASSAVSPKAQPGMRFIDDIPKMEPILQAIRERLTARLPAYMVPTTWLCVNAMPMLPSRKMDRRSVTTWVETVITAEQCQRIIMAVQDTIANTEQGTSSSLNDIEVELRRIWGYVLNLPEDQVSPDHHSFLSLGGDSISAMACANHAKRAQLDVTVQNVLRAKSLRRLARTAKPTANLNENNEAGEEVLDSPCDLSPIQQLHFQVRGAAQGDEHFNQSFCLRISRHTDPVAVHNAFKAVISRHGMLRARFHWSKDGQWHQTITSELESSYRFRFHNVRTSQDIQDGVASAQCCLDIGRGPIVAAEMFAAEDTMQQILFLTAHHLVVDLVSWRIILEEMEDILRVPSGHKPPAYRTMAFAKWAALQRDDCSSRHSSSLSDFLLQMPAAQFSYWGMLEQPNNYGDVVCGNFELDDATASTLSAECNIAFRTETLDILLAALVWSFRETFDDRTVPVIFNEGHGREPIAGSAIDISRTVGWFTTLFPVALSSPKSFEDVLVKVKDLRRSVEYNGRALFASQFHVPNLQVLQQHKEMEITFNFLGRYQQLERDGAFFLPAEGSLVAGEAHAGGPTADFGAAARRFALFEISAVIVHGALRFNFAWNGQMHHQERIRTWVSRCHHVLLEAAVTLPQLGGRITLSDIGLFKQIASSDLETFVETFVETTMPALTRGRGWGAIEDIYPASPIQQGLLLSRSKDDSTYAVRRAFKVSRKRDDAVLLAERIIQAWKLVVQRHALLRTVFVEAIGQIRVGGYDQVVLREVDPVVMLREFTGGEQEVQYMIENLSPMQYDNDGLQHRLSVFYDTGMKNTAFCVLELSHAVMDGASMDLLARDLLQAYEGTLEQTGRPLFSPFVACLQQRNLETDLKFWTTYLDGVEPCQFPILTDGTNEFAIGRELRALRVNLPMIAALRSFCNNTGVTIPNAIHAAWGLTLAHYTGSDDVCFGYLVSGRDAEIEGSEEAIGPFINMATQRVKLSDGHRKISLLQVLESVQRDQLDSMPFAQASLAEVQHALHIPGGLALFNTCVSYRRLVTQRMGQGPLRWEDLGHIRDPTEYPISLNIEMDENGEAAVDLDFWTDSIAADQAEYIAATFFQALSNIADHAELPCLHGMVEEQVEVRPAQQAIRGWDGDFTYAEMDATADRLAAHLFDLGVGPDILVPVCFDKSAYTTIAMLAVLKAGGCIVPLNANDPISALENKVVDTNAHVVVASESRAPAFEAMVPYVVAVRSKMLSQLPDPGEQLQTGVTPTDPAFVMFTSGSTGKPKGVVLSHSALASSILAHGSALGLSPSTRFLQFAAHTFDNSIEEMFTTLIHGGCVCVPSEADRLGNLPAAIDALDANFMDLTPTVAALLRPDQVPKIRGMAVGGEALTQEVLDAWADKIPVHNQYGPSECSINATHRLHTNAKGDVSNIGTSVGSVSWVVDPNDHDRLVPIGCVGELLIEGPILARGYFNRPNETAKSFIEMPKWATDFPRQADSGNRRMYKTGDLVRYNSDGSLIYLGRKDTQVKLHGQRIEPGEIDYHVKTCLPPAAQSSVELVTVGKSKALAVFICLAPDSDEPVQALPVNPEFGSLAGIIVGALSANLASYMVPSLFIPVSTMPLTSSGKLDRRGLHALVSSLADVSAYRLGAIGCSGRAPETCMERKLQGLWASVLGAEPDSISADDSFIRHGGDSIGAMRLVAAARKSGVALTVTSILQGLKLSEMAHVAVKLDGSGTGDPTRSTPVSTAVEPFSLLRDNTKMSVSEVREHVASICRIDSDDLEDIYPCTPLQAGLVAVSQMQPGAYVAVNSYKLPVGTDISRFKKAWQDVVDAEAILRTRVVFVDGIGFLQVVVRTRISWATAASVDALEAAHRHLPPHDGGILSRYTIVGENTREPQFVWTAHHALYDGWSLPTLLGRVEERYRESGVSTTPTPHFSRFIEYVSSVDRSAADAFWTDKLSGSAPLYFPQLPHPGYRVQATSSTRRKIPFARPRTAEATTATYIRAAWAVILSIYTGSDDVVFGEVLNGRDVPVTGIEHLVGSTLTSVPRRIRVDRDLPVGQALAQIQGQLNDVIPHQFSGLQHIKTLSSSAAAACDFQNILVIDQADELTDADSLWRNMTSSKQGADFFNYPLNVTCTVGDGPDGLELHAMFDGRVIAAWKVVRILGQFEKVLSCLVASDRQQDKMGDMDLLTVEDKAALRQWNEVPGPVVERRVHDVICEQMASQPEHTAVVGWDATLSNSELDALSSVLAQELRVNGIGSGTGDTRFVPFCFAKSTFAVVAMLAILKAGAAFVPLDPSHPVARLREIVGDCAATVVLCSPMYEQLCSGIAETAIPVDMDRLEMLKQNRRLVREEKGRVDPIEAAYVIFTSGTTGKPKGTIISHRAFCSSAAAHGPAMLMVPPFRFLQFASYTFDASLVETLTTLMMGGTVCVPSDADRLNGNIAAAMESMRVTMALLTPSFAKVFSPAQVPHLKTLILGGEAMARTHVETWAGKVNLVNAYGPSECSVVATVNPHMGHGSNPANLGRGTGRVWIVDPRNHHRLAPIGSVGELVVEGPTLSAGYLRNESKTREVFIENPTWAYDKSFTYSDLASTGSRRMYKTGDLVRIADDASGEMIYVGRKDASQTKLNGQRLELDDVAHNLGSDDCIRHAVVLLPGTGPCAKRLVAIVSLRDVSPSQERSLEFDLVLSRQGATLIDRIEERLREKVPPYMIPSTWLVLRTIPLLPSGKLDRGSVLRFVEGMSKNTYDKIVAAQSPSQGDQTTVPVERSIDTHETLKSIWSQVLNISHEQVTKNISFLHLGGDSITAMQVMARCRAEGISLTVQDIIGSKSIHDLALKVRVPKQHQQSPVSNEDYHEFDLSPIQQLYFEQIVSDTVSLPADQETQFNQSVLLRLVKQTSPHLFSSALHALVSTHSMLRARFRLDGKGNWRQRITSDVSGSYCFKTHAVGSVDRMRKRIEASQRALDIQKGPLMAADWFTIGKEKKEVGVFITVHHAVIDVVSWGIVLQDLEDFLSTGTIGPFTSLPFQAWTRNQSEQAQAEQNSLNLLPHHETADADLEYWGMATTSNLHGDVAAPREIELDADTTKLLLGPHCHESLKTEPLDVLLAALLLSYRHASVGRHGVPTIYNEGHGREVWEDGMDLSRTVGWFTSLCPVHLPEESSSDYDVVNAIRWVKDYRGRLAGKGRPYFAYRLLTSQGRKEYAQRWPVEVAFNYLGQLQQLSRTDTFLRSFDEAGNSVNSASDVGKDVPRFALVEVSAFVACGKLKLAFAYNKHMKHQDSLVKWASECKSLLQDAVRQLSQLPAEQTLSAFPLLPLAYYGLENLSRRLQNVGISLHDVENIYPCSPMQRGLLLSWMRDPEKYAYKAVFQVESSREEVIDTQRLLDAWQSVVQRHATLRTVFIDTVGSDDLMDQVVLHRAPGHAQVLPVCVDREEMLQALQQMQAIDYNEKKPPHRLSICTTASGDVFCGLEISHTICDGSSLPILLDDLADAFDGAGVIAKKPVPCYSDYMSYIQSQPRSQSLSYWRRYLGDTLGSYIVAFDRLDEINTYCVESGITLSTLLQFVWALVIRSYTGSDEVVFGYLASGRDVPVDNIEHAVGAFINLLVCRLLISEDTEIGEALDTVRADISAAMAHQRCSLAEIQHELKLDGALFNTAFTYQKRRALGSNTSTQAALQYRFLTAEDPSEYAVAVNVEATDRAVEVHFSHWRNTVSDAQMKNVAATFKQILDDLVADGPDDRTVGEVDLVGTSGVQQICSWNSPNIPHIERCVHDIISDHALRLPPAAPAVYGWDASFTYRELDVASTALARHLVLQGGIGPNVFVPLCFEKSAWTVVAQVGVLKAGGAFVNLDPGHPQGRLEQAIQDVEAMIVLCSAKHKATMEQITDKTFVVDAHAMASLLNQFASGRPFKSPATPSDAAYIIFTSGTTGKPKGTIVEHGSFCTGATAHAQAMFMRSDSRVLQFASYTFDASVMETLSCLLVGGCVCVPSDEDRMNDVAAVIRTMGITWTLLTPSVAGTLKPESLPCLKTLVTGGEAMTADHIERWGTRCALVNAYGPTECSVVATTSTKVDESHCVRNTDSSNIGTAVGGRVWVVDARNPNRLVPVGAVGELLVEGRLVGRGYLKEMEKTERVFITSPAWTTHPGFPASMFPHGTRMYRTGDLVHLNSDGSVSYVSRIDTQVKLNGRRIELGEIEFHCRAGLPQGAQAAVEVVVPAKAKTLALFFSLPSASGTGSAAAAFTPAKMTSALRELARAVEAHITASLPVYMVPQLFVPVSTMPLTAAGKLDRRQLRLALEGATQDVTSSYRLSSAVAAAKRRAPATKMEETLQALWETTLGLPAGSVGVMDNFFGVGGDSLTAIRLVGAARARKIRLSVLDIFEKPVLANMALACGNLETQVSVAEVKPIDLVPSTASQLEALKQEVSTLCQLPTGQIVDMYPCSPLQEGLVALANKQEGAYVAVNTLRIPNDIDLERFKAAWQDVADTTDTLRTRIVHTATSGFLQVVAAPEPMEWHNETSVNEAIAKGRVIGSQNGGRLTRYAIVQQRGEPHHHFIWAIHHALYDGWSLPMIARRVQDVYNAAVSESPETRAACTTAPYVNFIQYLARRDVVASENHWKDYLSGAASITHFPQLPSNAANRAAPKFCAETIHIQLNRKDVQVGITIPTLVRSAWALLLAAYNGTDDVAFGETISGRNIDVEGIMEMAGPTFTTVPVRVQLSPNMPLVEYLQMMHNMASQVVPHQHFGLQRIMKLNPDCAAACDFKNLLTIRAATTTQQEVQLQQEQDADWDFEGGSPGEGFFTHPLVLECNVTDSEIAATFHYDEMVLSQWHTKRLSHQLEAVLRRLVEKFAAKDARVADVDVTSPEDYALVTKWNRPSTSADVVDSCIHDLFLQQAATHPESIGLSAWDAELTYGEIREYASRLSRHLRERGVAQGTLVPVCLGRSAWAIVILMGILMAGGAFVPFDPAHPLPRQKQMLEDLAPLLIVCSPAHASRFADIVETRLSVDGPMLKGLPPASLRASPSANSDTTAYVLFTSGSTGRPKGVEVAHRDFCSSSRGFARATHIEPSSRAFHFASLTFDVALMEVLTPLTIGACVCIPTADERLQDLSGAIARLGATWAFLTPSVANLLDPDVVCPGLRTLVCGGEAMVSQTIARLADCVELMNGYGPTEASVLCIVNPRVSTERDPTIIGRGTLPARTWILQPGEGREHHLAPVGAVGELAISGPLLARGYKDDIEKTAWAFVDNPAWAKRLPGPGTPTRIYRTGDLVRYRVDGALEFLGRKDGQVKINGQRIELGEIDSCLSADHRVNYGLVLQPKTGACRKQLVGVITLASTGSVVAEESVCTPLDGPPEQLAKARVELVDVKSHLADVLPHYMVPTAWIVLVTMPVVVSGKLDRKRVTSWVEALDSDTYETIARNLGIVEESDQDVEVTGTAKVLRDIWAKELQIPVEKVHSNRAFLSLGGDSIRAMGVVSRARTSGLGMSIQDVLRSRSIVHLAQVSKPLTSVTTQAPAEEETSEPFGLSPIQRMYMHLSSKHTGDGRFNQSNVLGVAGRIPVATIKRAMDMIVQRHPMLRARFVRNNEGAWEQRIAKAGSSAYRCLEHSVRSRHDLKDLMAATQRDLSIEDGPVFSVDLFKVSTEDHTIIYMVAHHLVVDIVSWRIILRDLSQVLETDAIGTDLAISYRSWLEVLSSHNKTVDPEVLLPFEEPPAKIDYWGTTKSLTYGNTTTESFELSEGTTQQALVDCHKAFRSEPMDIFLGAVAHAFASTFPDRDVPTLHTESHGRDTPTGSLIDLSGTVGWFTTICPLVAQVSANDALDAVRRVKDIRRTIPANGRPYFAHKYLSGDASSSPMEVLFNYMGGGIDLEDNRSDLDPLATADVGPETKRLALFEISAVVINGKLHFSFIYDHDMTRAAEVHRWIGACKMSLEAIVHGLTQRATEPTLSDYPLLPMTYDDLATLTKVTLPRAGVARPAADVEDIYPCTPVQEGMLISQLRNPSAYIFHAIYNVGHTNPTVAVDAEKIAWAWQTMVDRHASLRTLFVESVHGGSVFDQVVLKHVDSGVVLLEARDEDAETKLGQVSMANRVRQSLLPHQCAICTTDSGRVLMKLEVNHVAVDGGSLSIVIGEFAAAYNGTLEPGPGPLFSDYVKFIRSQPANADSQYWMRSLVEACAPRFCSSSRFKRLRRLSEQTQVTLANIMHAAWAFVLRKYTGSDDVCFGYLTADRDAPVENIRSTVGTLINMLCCRIRIYKMQTLEDVFRTTQDQHLESTQYQRCSLANVQHALGMAGKALYNTSISTQNHSRDDKGGEVEDTVTFEMHAGHDPSEYVITVNIETTKDEEGAVFRYWSDHVSDEQAQDVARSMARVLDAFLNSPAQAVAEYDDEQGRDVVKRRTKPLRIDTSGNPAATSDSRDTTPTTYQGTSPNFAGPGANKLTADGHEAILRSLWSTILSLPGDNIRPDDSFFEIGGDSITAMKLVGEARDHSLTLSVADVFQKPTFGAMAARILEAGIDASTELLAKDGAEPRNNDQYQHFSLLAASNVDAFLQTNIVPQVCVFRGGLSDVLPATDFQSLAVSGALLQSQFMLNHFYLDGKGQLDLVQLRRACLQLVQDLDILRTVFVPSGGRFLQVVLRTLRPSFDTVDLDDESIQNFTASLLQRSRDGDEASRPRLGEPFVEFTVVRHRPTSTHRILLRISHAQYDGVCLPRILEALKAAYEGYSIPSPPSFANYLRASAGELTSEHYQHWTKLLEGSTMTEFVSRNGPNYHAAATGMTIHLQKTVHLPPVDLGHVTTATVIKAAWAYVLARVSSSTDVIFGHTISGRNASVDGVANMIGPCVNLLPVRVQFNEPNSTARRLFQQVQDQHVANMSHEVVGFRDIIRHCTTWPNWTYFTSTVQHQNLEPNEAVRIGDIDYTIGCASTDQADFSDLNVVSQLVQTPDGADNMYEITLSFVDSGAIAREFAQRALDMLCETAEEFAVHPDSTLLTLAEICRKLPQVPFPEVPTTGPSDVDNIFSRLQVLNPGQLSKLSELVTSAWRQVVTLPEG
ncbi:non-ribosomal peptide synthetase [Coniochaeta sp. 2T2.1]|nr:non-ribosomal peptide synthetase [Coniochaeta sp. 2T2.1]